MKFTACCCSIQFPSHGKHWFSSSTCQDDVLAHISRLQSLSVHILPLHREFVWSNFPFKLAYPSLYSSLQKNTKQVLTDSPSVRSRGYDHNESVESVTEFFPVCFQFRLQPQLKQFCIIVFCSEATQCQGWQQSQLLTCCLKHMVSTSWDFNLMARFYFDEVSAYKTSELMLGQPLLF